MFYFCFINSLGNKIAIAEITLFGGATLKVYLSVNY